MSTAGVTLSNFDVNAELIARYLGVASLVIVAHDLTVSFGQERKVIWSAPRSFSKYAFLANRYITLISLFITFITDSGFYGLELSNLSCRLIAVVISTIMFISLAIGNWLIAARIIVLWDRIRAIQLTVWALFAITYITSIATSFVGVQHVATIVWSPEFHSCTMSGHPSAVSVLPWAAPLAFELFLVVTLVWNAVDRPRRLGQGLAAALRTDGLVFMIVMVLLRAIQVGLVASQRLQLTMMGTKITWALITVTLSRCFLSIRIAELTDTWAPTPAPDSRSVFALARKGHGTPTTGSIQGDTTIELSRVVETESWDDK